MKYSVEINVDYSKGVVTIACPETSLTHGSEFNERTIAKTLGVPINLIAEQVRLQLKAMEEDN